MKVLFASLALLVAPAAFAGDECEAQIPQSLRSAIELKYPTFRTPLVTDNSPDDVEWYRRKKRNPCLGVAVADFDGDGGKDVLLALVERNGPGYVVVVAFSKRTTWDLSQLDKRKDGRLNLYVSTPEEIAIFRERIHRRLNPVRRNTGGI